MLRYGAGNHQLYCGAAAFAGFDDHIGPAHHFQPLPDIYKCSMRLALVRRIKTCSVVLHDDFSAGSCTACPDGDILAL